MAGTLNSHKRYVMLQVINFNLKNLAIEIITAVYPSILDFLKSENEKFYAQQLNFL